VRAARLNKGFIAGSARIANRVFNKARCEHEAHIFRTGAGWRQAMKLMSKVLLAGAMGATVMATAAPAQAHGWYRGGGGNGAAVAVGAGILGLAVGAAIASDRPRGYVVEERYAPPPPPPPTYYYEGPAYYGGGYYAPPPRTYVYREVYRGGPSYYGYGYHRWHRGW